MEVRFTCRGWMHRIGSELFERLDDAYLWKYLPIWVLSNTDLEHFSSVYKRGKGGHVKWNISLYKADLNKKNEHTSCSTGGLSAPREAITTWLVELQSQATVLEFTVDCMLITCMTRKLDEVACC